MSVDAPTPATVEIDVPLPDLTAQFAQLQAFEDRVKAYVAECRSILSERMLETYDQVKAKTFTVEGPDGQTLVTFTLKETTDKIEVGNPQAFLDWVTVNHPTEVEINPGVNAAFQTALLKRVKHVDDEIIDTATGQVVEGLRFVKGGGRPSGSFQTSWKGGADAKSTALGMLAEKAVGDVLAIGGGE